MSLNWTAGLVWRGVRAAALIWLAGRSGEPISVLRTYEYLKDQPLGRHEEKKESNCAGKQRQSSDQPAPG
jgi:hypothetical protein